MSSSPYRPRWLGGNRKLGPQNPKPVQDGRAQRQSKVVERYEPAANNPEFDAPRPPMGWLGASAWGALAAALMIGWNLLSARGWL